MKKKLRLFLLPHRILFCKRGHKPILHMHLLLILLCLAAVLPVPVQTKADGLISIDTEKKYKGMSSSFAKGYIPSVKKNTLLLVVPFQASLPLADDSLYVGVSFEREENCPFLFQNYQKKVKKSGKHTYLYQCKIKLRKNRINGQYPLHLTVRAQTAADVSQNKVSSGNSSLPYGESKENPSGDSSLPYGSYGEMIQQDFIIYVEITDGKNASASETALAKTDDIPQSAESGSESGSANETSDNELIRQPKLMLTENSIQAESGESKDKLQAGSSALWIIAAKNCSSSQPIENMKVTLLSDSAGILFEKNSWYFEQIPAGAGMDLSQTITIDKKAPAQTIPIQFQFDYEDKKGTAYSITETARLSIAAMQQAELVDLSFPESIYESDTNSLTFQVQNTGLGIIYNARVRLEGRGLFPERELFLGNMESGTSSDGEISVFAGTLDMDESPSGDSSLPSEPQKDKYGITTARVIFSYEDEQGTVTEQEFQLQTAIKKPQTIELNIEEQEPETNQWWITIVFFIILTLALVIIWLCLRIKSLKGYLFAIRQK